MADITVIILTFNEQKHIERCIRSVQSFARRVLVVDSFSTDATEAISRGLGADFVQHSFTNQAEQFNWALDNVPIATEWVLRMDADEYVLPELASEIERRLSEMPATVTGINLKRRVVFMGRWIKHGGYYPIELLRLFRRGKARSEQRAMDEHIRIVEGKTVCFENDIVDENMQDLTWWTQKHNNYASREARELFDLQHGRSRPQEDSFHQTTKQAERKRWVKEKIYARMPIMARPLAYFLYRYVLLLGFLDGREGLIWHVLQGFWYRFLVDAKLLEAKRRETRQSS